MMLASRLKWLAVPLALGLGAGGGVVINRQMMDRSIEGRERPRAAEVPAAQATKPPAAGSANPGRSPFDLSIAQGQPPSKTPEGAPTKVKPPLVARGGRVELEPPPGYFDVAPLATKDVSGPAPVKPGQMLVVEVLEAMPGRPITGERIVRPDGTISLGFYGDLPVAGLNRNQIKVKVIEHLRKFLNDEVLGLMVYSGSDETFKAIPPLESNRIFIDEYIDYARPTMNGGRSETVILNGRVDELDRKLGLVFKEMEDLRAGRRPAETPPTPE